MEVVVKRIYDPASPDDGYRVLVDRLWPRGVSREQANIALWEKDLAPSPELRKWFSHDPKKFAEFARKYRLELESSQAVAAKTLAAALDYSRLTLLYAAKDTEHNHAVVLQDWLADIEGT